IINTHGIKGEVKVLPFTDNIHRFDELKKIYIGEYKLKVEITNVRYKDNIVMLKFDNYHNINEVEKFKNQDVYIDEKDKIELNDNQFFIFDIIGCTVLDTFGRKIGTVIDVIKLGSSDIYVIKDNSIDKEYLIPAVEEFIKDINIEEKIIKVDPIEGLI
ncbi:MAG TPA: ribosome maturation factor RimM, partial [Tissierellales bacterium]|nr:ribosome maturation factor RimM [Tissierellales bacterium]